MNLKKHETKLRYLYSKLEMLEIKYKESPTIENKEAFFSSLDSFDDKLNIYYSDYLTWLKTTENNLFETFLGLKKETVKRNLLSKLMKEWKIYKENQPIIWEQKFNVHTELKK